MFRYARYSSKLRDKAQPRLYLYNNISRSIKHTIMEQNEACPHCAVAIPYLKFSYCPLEGEKAIRLLELQAGGADDEIHCNILYTSLDPENGVKPSYIALSYVWGPPSFEDFIFCDDGAHFHITQNLQVALRALRMDNETRTFWIDQICINQSNDEERCSQIQIMKDIYQQAERVIGWLGESTGDSAEAFRFIGVLDEMLRAAKDIDPEKLQKEFGGLPEVVAKGMLMTVMVSMDLPGLLALQNMFLRPWFSRMWIIQEAVLAKDLTLQWGSEQWPWAALAEIVAKIEDFYYLKVKLYSNPAMSNIPMLILGVEKFKTETEISLRNLLVFSNLNNCTDPRDKIFALLGLIKNSSSFGIIPRYDIPVYAIYRHATAAMILHEMNLHVLFIFYRSPYQRLQELPSWSLDFSNIDMSLMARPMIGWDQFKADKVFRIRIRWHEDPNLLTLSGRVIDTITEDRVYFDPPLFDIDVNNEDLLQVSVLKHFSRLRDLLDSCRKLCELASLRNKSKTDRDETHSNIWRALVGGLQEDRNLAGSEYSKYYQDYSKYVEHASTVSTYEDIHKIQEGWSHEQTKGCLAYSRALLEAGKERQFTVTESGRLGWLPKWVQAGDRVAAVHGCRLPIIIRAFGEATWSFVSGCYLDGVMFGEAFEDDDYKTEDITLR